jgi:hypothetical protein
VTSTPPSHSSCHFVPLPQHSGNFDTSHDSHTLHKTLLEQDRRGVFLPRVGLFVAPPSFPWPFPWFSPMPEGCFPFRCCLVRCLHSCLTDFSVCFGFLAPPLPPSMRDGLVSFLGRVGTEGNHSHRIDVLGVRTTLALHLRSSELMTPATTAIKSPVPSAATASNSTLEGGLRRAIHMVSTSRSFRIHSHWRGIRMSEGCFPFRHC